ncbi:MAG TPA: NAD-dependent epimerase/dehydratase family protein [Candidatus Eisenbacteria bacterium]|nr:NAD-dependent epimerase/dehydratase family protein [Candidatus Eisenbacteria bacterium]
MRVLICGGTGCIGSHVAQALLAAGHDVTVLARHEAEPTPGVRQVTADRGDPDALARALAGERFDLTVDLLAWDQDDVFALHGAHVGRLGRVILISSGQVCLVARGATPPYREADGEGPALEEPAPDTPDHRQWAYGIGKRRAEAALRAHAARAGTEFVILRLPIVQGAGDRSRRLQAWIDRLRDGAPVPLPDGGTRPLRFVWAGDVGRAVATLAARWRNGEPVGEVYHLAQPDTVTLRVFLDAVAAAMRVRPVFFELSLDRPPEGLDPAAWPYASRWCSVLDPARAEREWGFEGTAMPRYLPGVVAAHLESPMGTDAWYAQRPREIELARRRAHAG